MCLRATYLAPCALHLRPVHRTCTLFFDPVRCTLRLVPRTLYLAPHTLCTLTLYLNIIQCTLRLVPYTLHLIPCTTNTCALQVQAQVAASLLQRGTIRFDSLAGVAVVSSLVKGMGQVSSTPTSKLKNASPSPYKANA